jgi:pimeloyl-ACP methyl ester carboxylesterase
MSTLASGLVRAGTHTFSVRESGSGDPVVLLHGIGSSSASWVPLFSALPGFHLMAWDAPGYGESTPLAAKAPLASDYASALADMLDALGLQRVFLVGHSLGALIAGAFAAKHPERVRALVLADPASGYGAAPEADRLKMQQGRLKMLADLGPKGMAEQRGAQLLSKNASKEALDLVRHSMSRIDPAGYTQAVLMLAGGRLLEDAARYPGPALVLCGSEDTVTPEEGCRKVAAALPNGVYRTLPGLGHASYVESPQMVADALKNFLQDGKHGL